MGFSEQVISMDLLVWIIKTWSIRRVEYYSALKRKEILTQTTTRRDPEGILLGEISQLQKGKYYGISRIGKFIEKQSRLEITRSYKQGKWGVIA